MSETERWTDKICISAYNNDAELTRNMISWTTSPVSFNCETLNISANCTLKSEAVDALLNSTKIQTIKCLQFQEIYISAEDFERLLTMPNLVELEISGGSSSDYGGSEYTYSTLSEDHFKILATSPHAQKLQRITLDKEELGDEMRAKIQEALPKLTSFNVF